MKVAIVTPAIQDPRRLFGAERLFLGLAQAFQRKTGADWIQVPMSEGSWEAVLQGYLDCFDLDLSSYDLVISTKTPTFAVQHPNHVCWLVHQIRVFYDRFDDEYTKLPKNILDEKRSQQATIHQLDNQAFQSVRSIFAIGEEPARRLKQYNGFDAQVLHPPVVTQGHYCRSQDYFLLPGRLHRWKRVDLVLRAMRDLPSDVPLLIPGTGDDESQLRALAGEDPRVRFLGFVGEAEMLRLYANALAVLFPAKEEDFGYVAIEAMLSHKPVIVCTDSGEPARLVENGRSGFVVKPEPVEIAAAMALLDSDRQLARTMGEAGHQSAPSQSWDEVVETLLRGTTVSDSKQRVTTAPDPLSVKAAHPEIRLLVTDNQVLDPAVGGSRVRVKEICKGLASCFSTEYIGAFDWPGPSSTDERNPPGWRCRVFSLSDLHYRLSHRLQRWVTGGSVIDISFSLLGHTSRRFLRALREAVKQADVVVFAHPWCYPLVKRLLAKKYVAYDSQNFEWGLRRQLLSTTWVGRLLVRYVRHVEGELARRSEEIWACSTEDAEALSLAYGVPRERFRSIPNCAATNALRPADPVRRSMAKRSMGWSDCPVVLFVGSGYGPNTEAAAYIVETLAPRLPHVLFVIAGSVKEDYLRSADGAAALPANVRLLGVVPEEELYTVLHASDIALNPVEMGSGTSLKVLQYMAAGLPVVSTQAGIRGIERGAEVCLVTDRSLFADAIGALLEDSGLRSGLGELAREEVECNYDWTVVTQRAAESVIRGLKYFRPMETPFFSVVIPTYNRPENLLRLLHALTQQTFSDFEVVVVDQSQPPVEIPQQYHGKLRIHYIHSAERGPALARNKGYKAAKGTVVAFTDDDCVPKLDWLQQAARHFDDRSIAGLEGRVESEHLGDPKYRTVSNVNFEGIGFMTANMFYRHDLLVKVGGFDERLAVFREDTDLAWRIMPYGEIPHARESVVFHPPHPVNLKRESQAERAKMFSADPLLFDKHPQRYGDLICREGHYRNMPGFWFHFARGLAEYKVEPPLLRLFDQLGRYDPEWWSAVQDGTDMTRHGLNADDVAALNTPRLRVLQKG